MGKENNTNSMLEVQAAVCLRKQVPVTVAGGCERRTESGKITAQYQALETKFF